MELWKWCEPLLLNDEDGYSDVAAQWDRVARRSELLYKWLEEFFATPVCLIIIGWSQMTEP